MARSTPCTDRQAKPGRKNSQSDGPSQQLTVRRYTGRFYLRLSGIHWQEVPHIQTERQNQGERIHRGMDLHGKYAFVDIKVDSISNSAEYIGMECPIQPDRQNHRERIPRGMDHYGYYVLVDVQCTCRFFRLSGIRGRYWSDKIDDISSDLLV